jgi:hypothetical protein
MYTAAVASGNELRILAVPNTITKTVKFFTSSDGGESISLGTGYSGNTTFSLDKIPDMAFNGSTVVVLGQNYTNETAQVFRSADGGLTWPTSGTPTKAFASRSGFDAAMSSLANNGSHFYGLFSGKITFVSSKDDGVTWSDGYDLATGTSSWDSCDIAYANGTLYAAWYDSTANVYYLRKSTDEGATWGSATTIATLHSPASGSIMYYRMLSMAVSDGRIYVACGWLSDGSGAARLNVAVSSDDGETWSNQAVVASGDAGYDCSLAAADGYAYVSYYNQATNKLNFSRSSNLGVSWSTPEAITDNFSVMDNGYGSTVVASGSKVYVVNCAFQTGVYTNQRTQLLVSADHGATW